MKTYNIRMRDYSELTIESNSTSEVLNKLLSEHKADDIVAIRITFNTCESCGSECEPEYYFCDECFNSLELE